MNIEWTDEQKNFVRKNYGKMKTEDIAATLGCCPSTVLNLKNKLNVGPKNTKKKKLSCDDYKNVLRKGQPLKLQIKVKGHKEFKAYEGVVIDKTDYFILLEGTNNIKTSFKYADFVAGDIKIANEEN